MPVYSVAAVYPGASPGDMEQLVSEPIEKALNTLEDIKELRSTSSDGLSVVRIEFEPSVDADRAYDQGNREQEPGATYDASKPGPEEYARLRLAVL